MAILTVWTGYSGFLVQQANRAYYRLASEYDPLSPSARLQSPWLSYVTYQVLPEDSLDNRRTDAELLERHASDALVAAYIAKEKIAYQASSEKFHQSDDVY